MKRLVCIIMSSACLFPFLCNAQVLQIYRKCIGLESYSTTSIDRLSIHIKENEAYHKICQEDFNERLYLNDIDSIVCLPVEEMQESSTSVSLETYLRMCMDNASSRFHVFSQLMEATGLMAQLSSIGYTLFVEPDAFWEKAIGINPASITIDDVKKYLIQKGAYPEAMTNDDYANPKHLIFQFVSYHLVPVKVNPYRLVIHANEYGYDIQRPSKIATPVVEYYPSMDSNHLLKLYESAESNGIFINRFPLLDNGRTGTGHETTCPDGCIGVRIQKENAIKNLSNGFIYPIEGLLLYDESTRTNLGKERLRFDAASLIPELMNNDIRKKCSTAEKDKEVVIDSSNGNNLTINEDATLLYCNPYHNEGSYYQGDFLKCTGLYDITLRLPPVPVSGNYQLRMGSMLTSNGSIFQSYWGDDKNLLAPQGIPTDWRQRDNIGWEDDIDESHDIQTDRNLQNCGWAKAPNSISSPEYDSARRNPNCLRNIILQREMQADAIYYLRFKCVFQGELLLDYFELVPENIYDQLDGEDIW